MVMAETGDARGSPPKHGRVGGYPRLAASAHVHVCMCYVMPCYAMLCHAMLCYAMNAMPGADAAAYLPPEGEGRITGGA